MHIKKTIKVVQMLVAKKTNYHVVEEKDLLRAKAKLMMTEGFITEADYTRYTKLFDRLYNKTIKLILKVNLDEFTRRLENMLRVVEAILWDLVRLTQMKDMTPINVRKYVITKKGA